MIHGRCWQWRRLLGGCAGWRGLFVKVEDIILKIRRGRRSEANVYRASVRGTKEAPRNGPHTPSERPPRRRPPTTLTHPAGIPLTGYIIFILVRAGDDVNALSGSQRLAYTRNSVIAPPEGFKSSLGGIVRERQGRGITLRVAGSRRQRQRLTNVSLPALPCKQDTNCFRGTHMLFPDPQHTMNDTPHQSEHRGSSTTASGDQTITTITHTHAPVCRVAPATLRQKLVIIITGKIDKLDT
ncbi:hypothetical protein E2C01_056361 [Portunus trituberculatus]|uniref:Uncharacterized protein n=1 Tax=Portunus trituberculatus TaxID=210409 RepID=A0A5B7GXX4_PORTR|nr:hypothetical protein [Portunus trituberculatus]